MTIRNSVCLATVLACAGVAGAAPIFLNNSNASVALGPLMPAEPFANRTTAASLASIMDLPTAASSELHNQSTHVWVSGGILELRFDLGIEYDLTTFHFWNYHSESHDVDDIDLQFFDASNALVGTISNVVPALGNGTGSDSSPIFAQNIALSFPSRVRFVTAVLSGSNNQVDFNNMGFTGELSNPQGVPEPSTWLLLGSGMLALGWRRWRG